jgi:hypothetical protein
MRNAVVALTGAMMLTGAAQASTVLTFDGFGDCVTAEVTITAGSTAEGCDFGTSPNGTRALVRSGKGIFESFWTAVFATPVSGVSVDLGDFGVDEDRLFLSGFIGATLVEEVTVDIGASFEGMKTLSLGASGLTSIVFGTREIGFGGIYADNLTFTASGAPSVIPLPAAGWLLLGGLAALGALRRRA